MKKNNDLTTTQSWIVIIVALLLALFGDNIFNSIFNF